LIACRDVHAGRLLARAALVVCLVFCGRHLALAQVPALIDAPAPPEAPATIARDAQHRATIRAVRLPAPLVIDGRLDEEVYRTVPPGGGFIQQTPKPGELATEETDFWVFFDDRNVYISMLLHETHPERRVATERRRDSQSLTQDDNVMFVLDTFYDRRNAFNFQVNGAGGFRDQLVTDGSANGAWNTVWNMKVADVAGGQGLEIVIPFKSLRYKSVGPQVWGFNIRRVVKWKNEMSYINPNPVAFGGPGINRLFTAASLVGIETPTRSKNLEIKPYAISTLTTDRTASVPFSNRGKANVGLDFKYGLTRGLTADLTVNTDFAQVEEDVQQVNLTRFSLFFPEKRDFFLEGLGQFSFAGQGGGDRLDGTFDVPTVFFSRSIGLASGQMVPVRVGGRVTGRARGFEVGLLNIQTGDKPEVAAPSTNFTAARVRRNIFGRSNIGVVATLRNPSSGNRNTAFGADSNLRYRDFLEANLYLAGTTTDNIRGEDNLSYRTRVAWSPDQYGFSFEHLKVGRDFRPEMGFVRRADFRNSSASARFSPRLRKSRTIRQISLITDLEHIQDSAATRLMNRDVKQDFSIEWHSSDKLTLSYLDQYERLPGKFRIAANVTVPAGEYTYRSFRGSYALGQQRVVSGTVSASRGSFYNGTRTTGGYTGRLSFSSRFIVEPGISLNRVALPYGDFSANLFNSRFVVTPTPRMQLASLVQINPSAKTSTASVRLRWEYTPGSELFVVYTDGRNLEPLPATSGLINRSFAVKVTRLVRF
jgi:hypothetical protein